MKLTLVKKEAEVPGVTTFIFQPDTLGLESWAVFKISYSKPKS